MVTPLTFYDLVDAFSERGCAVCSLVQRDIDQFLRFLFYEYVNDPDTHRAFRTGRGLCSVHGEQLTHLLGSSLGIAMLYHAAIDEVLQVVERADGQPGRKRWGSGNGDSPLAAGLEPTGPCLACTKLLEIEQRYIQTLAGHLTDARLAEAHRASDGLCLPHFRQALRQADSAVQRELTAVQREQWRRLKHELQEFIDKNDYRRIGEAMGAEGDSWLRAIERLAGRPGLFGLRRQERFDV